MAERLVYCITTYVVWWTNASYTHRSIARISRGGFVVRVQWLQGVVWVGEGGLPPLAQSAEAQRIYHLLKA